MKRKLKELAEIRAGFSFRETIPIDENGNHRVIQIKDVTYEGTVSGDDLIKTNINSIKTGHSTKKDNVLFTARGAKRRAGVVGENAANCVFVSQLYALEIKSDVLPKYLAWYLNQKPAQEFFEEHASGSYIQNIRQDVLIELLVIVPPVKTQRKIVAVYELSLREKHLAKEILTKRQQIVRSTLLSMIKE